MIISPPSKERFNDAERSLIRRSYSKLLHAFKTPLSPEDKKKVRQAYELAVDAHDIQRRKTGEPYILHPIEVARICVEEIGLGPTAAIVALLHDVVEDTKVKLDDIKAQFDERISQMVDGLTKLDKAYDATSPQAENFKKVLVSLAFDTRVVFIKMADRLHNMRTIGSMEPQKQLRIAAETVYLYIPLAHRLGFYAIKTEFEELCMQVIEPETYAEVVQKLQETQDQRKEYIDSFCEPIIKELDSFGVPYRITGRPKSIVSIASKIKSKNVPFEDIYDLFAIRIVLNPKPEHKESALCWYIYTLVADLYLPVPERLKDWVSRPKPNGYESLHTTVVGPKGRFVEVQIRTERMDDISERGYAAHWKYKGIGKQAQGYEDFLQEVRKQVEVPTNAVEFMSDFESNLFQVEVYVFTPKGAMITLPKGATALDFAFHIHSELGCHCNGVFIQDELVPLGTKLKNGDQIRIITSKKQKPNESWLKNVITNKARTRIRQALRQQQYEEAEVGKEALERKLKALGATDFEKNVEFLMKHFGYKMPMELYYNIAIEAIDLMRDLKVFKIEHNRFVEAPATNRPVGEYREDASATLVAEGATRAKPKLLIDGQSAEIYEYSFGACCNPVTGDEIFAFQTKGEGYKIHRNTCPNATNLLAQYVYRVKPAEWTHFVNNSFVTELVITGVDGPGVLERLSTKISTGLALDIRSFSIDVNSEGYYEGRVRLVVSNRDQLNRAIIALKSIESVTKVLQA